MNSLVNNVVRTIIQNLGLTMRSGDNFCRHVYNWMMENQDSQGNPKFTWDVFNEILDYRYDIHGRNQNIWNAIIINECYKTIEYIFKNGKPKEKYVNLWTVVSYTGDTYNNDDKPVKATITEYRNPYVQLLYWVSHPSKDLKDSGKYEILKNIIIFASDEFNGNEGYKKIQGDNFERTIISSLRFPLTLIGLPRDVYEKVVSRLKVPIRFDTLWTLLDHYIIYSWYFETLLKYIPKPDEAQMTERRSYNRIKRTITQALIIALLSDHSTPLHKEPIDVSKVLELFINDWGGDPTLKWGGGNMTSEDDENYKKVQKGLKKLDYELTLDKGIVKVNKGV